MRPFKSLQIIGILLCLIFSSCVSKKVATPITTFTVIFNANNESNQTTITVNNGDTITEPTNPTKTGYIFTGWYKDDTKTTSFDFNNEVITENITLYAKWGITAYEVKFNTDTSETSINPLMVNYGDKINKPITPTKINSVFAGWYKNNAKTTLFDFNNEVITKNITLYAKWELNIIEKLKYFLNQNTGIQNLANTDFAKENITKQQAEQVKKILLDNKQKKILEEYGSQWDNRSLKYNNYTMPFYYNIFGAEPQDGRSLIISLHGGGGAPAATNDQQYENQKHLYDSTMNNLEAVYLAPRSPTNTWNMWHQSYMDEFLNIIIQTAVAKLNVNPNRVYIIGYSAGGDGLYRMGPRMADRWAAATMMAGHPGSDSSILNLRNLPFGIYMGGSDSAYQRNVLAQQYIDQLEDLRNKSNLTGYIHRGRVYPGVGHWMGLRDKESLPWMRDNFIRNPIPKKVTWDRKYNYHSSFYWLKIPDDNINAKGVMEAEYNTALNEINVIQNDNNSIELFVNDNMLDLDRPIIIKYKGNVIHTGVFKRTILNLSEGIQSKGDSDLSFSCKILIENQKVVEN